MSGPIHEASKMNDDCRATAIAFNDADLIWHNAIIDEFGPRHGIDARYDGRARGQAGSILRTAYENREAKRVAWQQATEAHRAFARRRLDHPGNLKPNISL